MILYYALGGGLGHIARSFALIAYAPKTLRPRIRLLVSSKSAELTRPYSPCPMDLVPFQAMVDRVLYAQFLGGYFKKHEFSCIVTDTFPFGLVGELAHPASEIPRVLVGRYMQWDAYRTRCGDMDDAIWPEVAVMIEKQEEAYRETMERHSRVISAQWPISLASLRNNVPPDGPPACCVVHSGPQSEIERLMKFARNIMTRQGIRGAPEVFTPQKGLFPLEHHLSGFSDIVTGAGYGSCAASIVLKGKIRYHFYPFPRRFDDQALRLERLREGQWGSVQPGDASTAAAVLWREIGQILKQGGLNGDMGSMPYC
jgi:hypothetical protein